MRSFLREIVSTAALLSIATTAWATDAGTLPSTVRQSLEANRVPVEAMSVAAIPLEGQGMAQFVNADKIVNPASTMKLVTTYAALELLGPTYTWRTELLGTGPISNGVLEGDLIYRTSGDPKMTLERMWTLLRDLRAAGVREVAGDLVLQPADIRLPADAVPFRTTATTRANPFWLNRTPC